jgi:hypothetical protein
LGFLGTLERQSCARRDLRSLRVCAQSSRALAELGHRAGMSRNLKAGLRHHTERTTSRGDFGPVFLGFNLRISHGSACLQTELYCETLELEVSGGCAHRAGCELSVSARDRDRDPPPPPVAGRLQRLAKLVARRGAGHAERRSNFNTQDCLESDTSRART